MLAQFYNNFTVIFLIRIIMRYLTLLVLMLVILSGCKDNNSEPDPNTGKIFGTVSFLDGTPGVSAVIDLKTLPTNRHQYASADNNGNYSFEELSGGSYVLKFQSTGAEINGFEKEIKIDPAEELREDILISYSILEESLARTIDTNIVMIMFEPNSAHIGDNYDIVESLSGGYYRDTYNSATLSAELYIIPTGVQWWETDFEISAETIKNDFEYVMDIKEETFSGNHIITFEEEDIPKILSSPENGFALVRKDSLGKQLKIPCVDFSNNDFGLNIKYK